MTTVISIIIPVFNEEENVRLCYESLCTMIESEKDRYDFELIFTDNHSTDRTFDILAELARLDSRIQVYRFSRNFGYQKSIFAGYGKARGAAAVQIDCDLQDPPELISEFLRKWEDGYQVVYGVRRMHPQKGLIKFGRPLFYWLVDKLSEDRLPREAGDFRLIDRVIVDQLATIRDPSIYIRGRIATMGFSQIGLPYDRHPRRNGESKVSIATLSSFAIDAITSHSVVPLRFATYVGLFMTAMSLLLIIGYTIARLTITAEWPRGWATLAVLVLFGIGLNGMFLGIIGEYLARIYLHLKQSGEVIVEQAIVPPTPDSATTGRAGSRRDNLDKTTDI